MRVFTGFTNHELRGSHESFLSIFIRVIRGSLFSQPPAVPMHSLNHHQKGMSERGRNGEGEIGSAVEDLVISNVGWVEERNPTYKLQATAF